MWLLVYYEKSDLEIEKQIIVILIISLSSFIALFLLGKVFREILMSKLKNSQNSSICNCMNNCLDSLGELISNKYPKLKSFIKENLESIYYLLYLR